MKISSTSSTSQTRAAGRAGKPSPRDGSKFEVDTPEASDPTAATAPTAASAPIGPIASIDALLAIQEADTDADAGAGRSKGLKRGNDLLDMLEGMRRAILLGVLSVADLRRLADTARDRRGGTGDAGLDAVLEEIELRAEVELAKYGY